jgi:hypothetical protein
MRYAQEKSGEKLHLVFTYNGKVSQPICGKKVKGYRMTINAPLGHACKRCLNVSSKTLKQKEKEFLLTSIK